MSTQLLRLLRNSSIAGYSYDATVTWYPRPSQPFHQIFLAAVTPKYPRTYYYQLPLPANLQSGRAIAATAVILVDMTFLLPAQSFQFI
jgi:hypothetical protein